MAWLEHFLADYPGTVVAVTHDRYFLDNVAGWILELDRGQGIPWKGNYTSWLEQKQERLAQEEKTESSRQRDPAARARMGADVARAPARPRARPASPPTRSCSPRTRVRKRSDEAEIHIPAGPRLGDVVVEAKGLRKGYGDSLLIEDLNFALPPGGIVGVIGPNGAGKTTLFRMIIGQETPDAGAHPRRRDGEARLRRPEPRRLDAEQAVWEEISDGRDVSCSAAARFRPAPTSRGSTSRARTSRSGSAISPAANATASTSPRC